MSVSGRVSKLALHLASNFKKSKFKGFSFVGAKARLAKDSRKSNSKSPVKKRCSKKHTCDILGMPKWGWIVGTTKNKNIHPNGVFLRNQQGVFCWKHPLQLNSSNSLQAHESWQKAIKKVGCLFDGPKKDTGLLNLPLVHYLHSCLLTNPPQV